MSKNPVTTAIIRGLHLSQQWQDKGFRSSSADTLTCIVAFVSEFYTYGRVGSTQWILVWRPGRRLTCYNWGQIAIWSRIRLFEKDLRLHWSGICDFYLLNCNREQSYYKYCQCSQNFLWVKNWNWTEMAVPSIAWLSQLCIPMYTTLFTANTGGSHVCSFEIALTASMNMYLLFWCLDLRWMTWFVSMYTFASSL